jgi:hypothetical protein
VGVNTIYSQVIVPISPPRVSRSSEFLNFDDVASGLNTPRRLSSYEIKYYLHILIFTLTHLIAIASLVVQ